MRPEQNARRTVSGWLCIPCFEGQVSGLVPLVVVRPLPRLAWWRRALAWFVASPVPEARARER
jgi:hypothetical protein